jgi:hypothetical protein
MERLGPIPFGHLLAILYLFVCVRDLPHGNIDPKGQFPS